MKFSQLTFSKLFFIFITSCIPIFLIPHAQAIKIYRPPITGLFAEISDSLCACASDETITLCLRAKNQLIPIQDFPQLKDSHGKIMGHNASITNIYYSKKHKTLASIDTSGEMFLWLTEINQNSVKINQVCPVKIPTTKNSFATAHHKTIIIWEQKITQFGPIQTLIQAEDSGDNTITGHRANVTLLAYKNQHKILASADASGLIILWAFNKHTGLFIPTQQIQTNITQEMLLVWDCITPAFVVSDTYNHKKTRFTFDQKHNKFTKR